jgi:lipoate-protein ligase A
MIGSAPISVIQDGAADGDQNMALDSALAGDQPIVRIYEWSEPWVTLGRFQDPQSSLLPGCPVRWTLRPTGGKAVLHGHDLTVAVFLPAAPGELSVKRAYRTLIQPIVTALARVGVRAALGEETAFITRGLRTADCFRHVSPNDVVDPATGRKLVGCALRIDSTGVLAQCSIPLRAPLVPPERVFHEPHRVGGIPEGLTTVAALRDALGKAFRASLGGAVRVE